MPKPALFPVIVAAVSIACILADTGYGQFAAPPSVSSEDSSRATLPLDALREELRQVIDEQIRQRKSTSATGRPGRDLKNLNERAKGLGRIIRDRIQAQLQEAIEREFGPVSPYLAEPVVLEALDKRGHTVDLAVNVQARPLRPLDVPTYASRAFSVLQTDGLTLSLYDVLPGSVDPLEAKGYRRVYRGDAAQALAAEAKLVVALKGGEWREPNGNRAVANAIAVRGLDLTDGLKPNGNQTYDDTMYLVIDAKGLETEVYEYRMTTESSNTTKGVGRLNSMQVVYVRGLHRGKDPAYRLKGNEAEGTREGIEGSQRICGANLHSAYSRREIESETPLSPNVSLGCQVVAASKREFENAVVGLLDKKGVKEFPYTIIDGDEFEVLDRTLAERGKHSLLVKGIPRKLSHEPQ